MMNDPLDDLIRKSIPADPIAQDRVEAMADMVLARLNTVQAAPEPSWVSRLFSGPSLVRLGYALPVVVAAVAGLLAGDSVIASFTGVDTLSSVMIVSTPLQTLAF